MSVAESDVFYPTAQSVLSQLRDFIETQVKRFAPDVIVVIERKGTAVYRAVLETSHSDVLPGWDHVVSSASLSSAPPELFLGRRIMVFDDMMRNGGALREILSELNQRGYTDAALSNVHVAAFASHEKAGQGHRFGKVRFPQAVYQRNLTTDAFRSVRSQIVTALQESGSLMLDTEHIEIRLTQRAPLSEIARALSRSGDVVAFHSAAGRTNLTVYYGGSRAAASEARAFPPGTRLEGVVRKCRVVERSPGEFALIPISLPDVPRTWPAWQPAEADKDILDSEHLQTLDDDGLFHTVALRASLEPLALAIKDLVIAGSGVCEFALPLPPSSAHAISGYDLSHLHVVYPWMDLNALHKRLLTTFSAARSSGTRLRKKKWAGRHVSAPHPKPLRDNAVALLQGVGLACDAKAAEANAGGFALTTTGLTLTEIMKIGREFDIQPHYVSACMDVLIDEALLITRVEELRTNSATFVGRTYLPDGEVASEQVRDFTRRNGRVTPPELP